MRVFLLIFITLSSNILFGQVKVRGYYKSNGTYVQPYERTKPNSTVTDNYSYPGNYNPNIATTTPTPNYNNGNSSNTTTSGTVWVDGYYRNDGTYVSGYYRNAPSNNSTNNNNISTATYQYVKAKKVNVRTTPSTYGAVYTTLNLNQTVRTIYAIGNWTKVEIQQFNNYSNGYETVYGYIKSSLLNDSYNSNYNNEIYSTTKTYNKILKNKNNKYTVTSLKAYFYKKPNKKYLKKAYLLYGQEIKSIKESTYYVYIIFKNLYGQKTKGWINKDDLTSL